jgi:hypothetical protein
MERRVAVMILPKIIAPSLLWFILWLVLMANTPMEASGQECAEAQAMVQTRQPDLGVIKDAALIGGTCSIITATIWACGLVAAARYKYLERRTSSCGDS